MLRSEKVKAVNAAILAAQGEFPVIDKSAINPFYKSKFAPYDGIMRIVRPIIVKNKLLIEHSVSVDQNELEAVVNVNYQKNSDKESVSNQIVSIPMVTVATRVTHADSEEWKEVSMTMPAEKGNSHGIQAVITYIKRNNIILLLDIVVGDEDDDANDSVTPDADRNYQRPRGNEVRPRQNQTPVQEAAQRQSAVQQQPPKHDLEKEVLDTPLQDVRQVTENPGSLRDLNQQIKNADKPATHPATQAGAPMTDAQRNRAGLLIGEEYDNMAAALGKLKAQGMDSNKWKGWLKLNYGVDSIQHVKRSDYAAIMEIIKMDPLSIDSNIKGVTA